jgi:hypothetical protein
MNSKMIKSRMVVLTRRKKVDVAVGWMLQLAAGVLVGEREREKADMPWAVARYSLVTTGTSLISNDADL